MDLSFVSSTWEDRSSYDVWVSALSATALIGLCPIVILFFVPLKSVSSTTSVDAAAGNKRFLNVLLSFAVGGLLGDVFLHLLPHAGMGGHGHSHEDHGHGHGHGHSHGHEDHSHGHGHDHGHGHSHEHHDHGHSHSLEDMHVGLWILCGIVSFLLIEKLVRNIHGADGHGHNHGHSHGGGGGNGEGEEEEKDTKGLRRRKTKKTEDNGAKKDEKEMSRLAKDAMKNFEIAGYLNLVADLTHNFTDGLALGASFMASHKMGLTTTFAVLLHEVPHEIGDFAILIQAGFSRRSAIIAQVVTALGAMSGTVFALCLEGTGQAPPWIMPFTAGGFIYISTVTIIPELLKDVGLWQTVKEVVALGIGVGLMVFIALIE